jgi:hypothetical protein
MLNTHPFYAGYFQGIYWLCFWVLLQAKEEIKDLFHLVSRSLEIVVMELFASNG